MFKLNRYFVLLIALLGIFFAFFLVHQIMTEETDNPPFLQPVSKPYTEAVSATGIIEAANDNVRIGSSSSGLVEKVFVKVWEKVEKGTPLFRLDSRETKAKLQLDLAKVEVAKAKLHRLQDQLERLQQVEDQRAISINELKTKEHDVAIAKAEYQQALSEAKLTETVKDRLTVRSPQEGTIMQCSICKGEWLLQDPKNPAILLGNLSKLQVRANIDEQNACQIALGGDAIAYPKNRPNLAIPLQFVRIEPLMIPKQSLTGQSGERVDTRVLQVIYTFEPDQDHSLFVGQQVDVYIKGVL